MTVEKPLIRLISNVLCVAVFLIAAVNTPATASESSEPAKIISTFSASDNSVKKTELLFSLKKYLSQKPLWIKELLAKALNDKSPVVVAEAVYQIGEFEFIEFNTELIKLFNDAEKRFGSLCYAERVRCAVIPALGKIGNNKAKAFIAGLLKNDKGSFMGQFMLSAMKSLNDPVFVKDVRLYRAKMEKYVKDAAASGLDPFLYSDKASYIKLAEEVETSLLKGGKNE